MSGLTPCCSQLPAGGSYSTHSHPSPCWGRDLGKELQDQEIKLLILPFIPLKSLKSLEFSLQGTAHSCKEFPAAAEPGAGRAVFVHESIENLASEFKKEIVIMME